jgi:hypothetical protein
MDGTMTTDWCTDETCVMPAEFVRLRYFFGQRLGVVDLADEQSYLVGKQRFHNRYAHGAGVLCGLTAERFVFPQGADPATATTLLRVRRGAALDWCGREIVVGWDQCIDVAAWYAQHPAAHPPRPGDGAPPPAALTLWVALCYRECPSDPAPAPRDPCGCEAGGCEFARVREGFELKLLTDDEARLTARQTPPLPALDFAADETSGGGLQEVIARRVAAIAGQPCPASPTDLCLLLASVRATLDPDQDKITDLAAPDDEVPERRSLLATAVLQQALLRALAAAADGELIGAGPRFGAIVFDGAGGDSGTLSIAIAGDAGGLSRDPFAAPAQLTATVSRFKDDGAWEAADPASVAYVATPSPHIELQWTSGLVEGGRYRAVVANDRAQPAVDAAMRPLTPAAWARHFRLQKGADGNLALAPSL